MRRRFGACRRAGLAHDADDVGYGRECPLGVGGAAGKILSSRRHGAGLTDGLSQMLLEHFCIKRGFFGHSVAIGIGLICTKAVMGMPQRRGLAKPRRAWR